MAWTTPRTWVAAELVSAALLNTHVRDNENALRDFALGAQDLAANWKISSGRTLQFQETGVGHGMTSLMPTDNWFQIAENTAGAGGAVLTGARDTDQLGLTLHGVNGSATPTVAGLAIQASKKSGTTTQSFAASEIAMQFYNGGTVLGNWHGSGLNVVGGLAVGYTAAPTAAQVAVGDANFMLNYVSATSTRLQFDSGDYLTFNRSANELTLTIGAGTPLVASATGVIVPALGVYAIGGGGGSAFVSGAILMTKRADPSAPAANDAYIYVKDNGAGKTQVVALFSSGAVQVIATQP